jgi:outer membrane lipoprotein SlyB
MSRYRSRVAAFATFVIALSGAKASSAAEVEGKVHSVDAVERTVTLDNGTKIWLGDRVAADDFEEGIEVRVSYDEQDGRKVATSVEKR